MRLIDKDLPGLARELALACCNVVDALAPRPPTKGLYRAVQRAVRGVLRARVQAFRFCGLGRACETGLKPTELGAAEWHEPFPPEPERISIYVTETAPARLRDEFVCSVTRAIVRHEAPRLWKGLARLLRQRVERVLAGRVFASSFCGDARICLANEPFDAWDRSVQRLQV